MLRNDGHTRFIHKFPYPVSDRLLVIAEQGVNLVEINNIVWSHEISPGF
jgi:hypothetical protein